MEKELLERIMKNDCKRQIRQGLLLKVREIGDMTNGHMSNGKVAIIVLIFESIKKISLYKKSYFPELYTCSNNKIKVELDLSNYATKSDLTKANRC